MGGLDCKFASRKRKIDKGQALALRLQGIDEPTIAKKFNTSKQAVNYALKPFKGIIAFLQSPDGQNIINNYNNIKSNILDYSEMVLITDILDTSKRQKATQVNAAYAFDKIATHNRLEKGQSTSNIANRGVAVELIDMLNNIEAEKNRRKAIVDDPENNIVNDEAGS